MTTRVFVVDGRQYRLGKRQLEMMRQFPAPDGKVLPLHRFEPQRRRGGSDPRPWCTMRSLIANGLMRVAKRQVWNWRQPKAFTLYEWLPFPGSHVQYFAGLTPDGRAVLELADKEDEAAKGPAPQ